MNSTIFLAQFFGCYLVIMSVVMLIRHDTLLAMAKAMIDNPGLSGMIAVMRVMIGLLILLTHWVWVQAWPVLITLLGVLILGIGLMGFLSDNLDKKWMKYFKNKNTWAITAVVSLALGLFLLYQGFMVGA